MATTVTEDPRQGVNASQTLDPLTAQRYGTAANPGTGDLSNYSDTGSAIKDRMPDLVKGAGFAGKGGNGPLTDQGDILTRAAQATLALRTETWRGKNDTANVVKSFRPDFVKQFGALGVALDQIEKSFTAGNLGIGSLYGLTPYNLLAPSRLIYPVYTVYRNKFARPPGQGASLMERLITGVSGSQTGGQGVLDWSIPELVQQGGSFTNWPLNLPGSGNQTLVNLN